MRKPSLIGPRRLLAGGTFNTNSTGGFEFSPQNVVVSATTVRGFYLSNPFQLVNVNMSLPTLPARIVGRFSSDPDVSVAHMSKHQFYIDLSTDMESSSDLVSHSARQDFQLSSDW